MCYASNICMHLLCCVVITLLLSRSISGTNFAQQSDASVWGLNEPELIAIISCLSAAILIVLVIAISCACKLQQAKEEEKRLQAEYGLASSRYDTSGSVANSYSHHNSDRKLAQSAQLYHYQHQKQQIIAAEKSGNHSTSLSESGDEENVDATDSTIYECPGLATATDMNVHNPLFMNGSVSANTRNVTLPSQSKS